MQTKHVKSITVEGKSQILDISGDTVFGVPSTPPALFYTPLLMFIFTLNIK